MGDVVVPVEELTFRQAMAELEGIVSVLSRARSSLKTV